MTDSPTSQEQLDFLLAECVRLDASDVHLAPHLPPYLRIHGILEAQQALGSVPAARLEELARALMKSFDSAALEKTGSLDGAVTAIDGTRFRFNIFRRQGNLAIALRRLEDRFRPLSDLGLPESLYPLFHHP